MLFIQSGRRDGEQLRKGRGVLELSQFDLGLIKCGIILLCRLDDCLVVRGEGLDHGAAGFLSPAAAPDHLRDQGERAFSRAIVPGIEALIGRDHADQRDVFKIEPLGDHLRADHDGDVFLAETVEQLFVGTGRRDGIRVHAEHFSPGKELFQFRLDHLRPRAEVFEFSPTDRAALVRPLGIAAIVAEQASVRAVVGHGNAAARALVDKAAFAAADETVCAPSVDKQDALFAAVDVLLQFLPQEAADAAAVSAAELALHIDDLNRRKLLVVITVLQLKIAVAPRHRAVHAHDIRRRRTEKQQTACLCTAEFGHIARVIARDVLRLVGLLLLLVNDDESERFHRRKNSAARADHDARFSCFDPLPLVIALPDGEAAVEDRHIIAEVRGKGLDHLRRERDLRNQQDHAFPKLKLAVDQVDIDAGLAAAGDAEEKRRSAFPGDGEFPDPLKRSLLLSI